MKYQISYLRNMSYILFGYTNTWLSQRIIMQQGIQRASHYNVISYLELIMLYDRPYGFAEGSVLVLVMWASHDLIITMQLEMAPNTLYQTYKI